MPAILKEADNKEVMVQCKKCRRWLTICGVSKEELIELATDPGREERGLYAWEEHVKGCNPINERDDYILFEDMVLPGLYGAVYRSIHGE